MLTEANRSGRFVDGRYGAGIPRIAKFCGWWQRPCAVDKMLGTNAAKADLHKLDLTRCHGQFELHFARRGDCYFSGRLDIIIYETPNLGWFSAFCFSSWCWQIIAS